MDHLGTNSRLGFCTGWTCTLRSDADSEALSVAAVGIRLFVSATHPFQLLRRGGGTTHANGSHFHACL